MKQLVLAVFLALVFVHGAFGGQAPPPSKGKAVTAPKKKPRAVAPARPAPPQTPFEAYAVADAADGQILEGRNLQLRWPQASLTKLMLAMVVVERIERGELRLEEPVTASKNAEGMGGTQVFLKAGETFSLDELMTAVLVESANDAAYAVAEHVAGRAELFVAQMNRKARSLGLESTEFHNVHGLPPSNGGAENLTTCIDMVQLARAALRHPQILEWTSIEQTTFRDGSLVITNKNKLVGRMPGVDGLKTGYYRRAGFNVVATGTSGEKRLIVVVLGSSQSKVRDQFAMDKLRENFAN
jgi:D-alanyl-D-alanine carboxypeptidase (penicillin-binding protein 5/6)